MTDTEKARQELAEAYKGDDWDYILICQMELLMAQAKERSGQNGSTTGDV